jgi:phage gpG-like protein
MSEIALKVKPKIKSRKLPNALSRLGKFATQLDKIGVTVVKEIRRNLSGRYLQKRSGDLYRSWDYTLQRMADLGYTVKWETDSPYGRIHEKGGMTGRKHRSRMKKTRYATRALVAKGKAIHMILRNYMARLFT